MPIYVCPNLGGEDVGRPQADLSVVVVALCGSVMCGCQLMVTQADLYLVLRHG